ncbi:MAG: hypothetical protein ACD_67C00137G0005 [uncultured bacterium]|nr:MAG: hypothetical protein ACD_67C00137G0005 [uncultured bacterium]
MVATDTGGTKELLTDNLNGLIVKTKDADDLAEKIEKIILNPQMEHSMSLESRKLAEKLSWGKVAGQYIELYVQTANLKKMKE